MPAGIDSQPQFAEQFLLGDPTLSGVAGTAAAMRGLSFSDFATIALDQAAAETFQQYQTMVLSERGMSAFVDALLNPGEPDERSKRYARLYQERLGAE